MSDKLLLMFQDLGKFYIRFDTDSGYYFEVETK